MATGKRVGRRKFLTRHDKATPYPLPSRNNLNKESEDEESKCSEEPVENKDWEEANCSVCLEVPHNAVLLLCSSHNNGCRPYMCATSYRYSNCLDQFEKAYSNVSSQQEDNTRNSGSEKTGPMKLAACPLCRGQVKGWTVVEPARDYLNTKKRSCMQENCTFLGSYKELRKHVKREHRSVQRREIDPELEKKWRRLESEREREDVISILRSSLPGALVLGDYVIERGNHITFDSTDEDDDDDEEDGSDEENGGSDMRIDDNNAVLFQQGHGTPTLNTQVQLGNYQAGSVVNGQGVSSDGGRGGGIGISSLIPANESDDVVSSSSSSDGEEDEDGSRVVSREEARASGIGGSERRRRRRSQRRSTMAVT